MNEKVFKSLTNNGAGNLVMGILTLVFGITVGVILIVSGARLLKNRSHIMI